MATPMKQQYNRLKKKHKDCILLFRLGDFYECFDNDAKIISKVLGIVLTKRGKGVDSYPMAGIPHHALNNYFPKLVKAGYKVAIVEQLEKPQQGKKIVDRDVVKIVSAGTVTSDKSLDEAQNNFLAAISSINIKKTTIWGLAVCDLTTGEFYINEFYCKNKLDIQTLITELQRIQPAELLISKENISIFKNKMTTPRIQEIPDYEFNFSENKKRILDHFKLKNLKGFGIEKSKSGIIAAGVILNYLIETQKASLSHINKIYYKSISNYMLLDANTIRNLELVTPLGDEYNATLLNTIDKCLTSMGKRKLHNWIVSPLTNKKEIEERLNGVEELFKDSIVLKKIRDDLDDIYDIERILGKVGTETVNARDLIALNQSLINANSVASKLSKFKSPIIQTIYKTLIRTNASKQTIKLISNAIIDDPPITITEGRIIKEGFNKRLAEIRSATNNGKEWLNKLQIQEVKRTGITSLKVKFNKVFGYYIEITKSNLDKVPENYIRKQTLVNAERFITQELKEKEELILNAEEKSIELEYNLFIEIREEISKYIKSLQQIANSIAILDCLANFASLARLGQYVKPIISKNKKGVLKIKDGRHLVVEKLEEEQFIPNDTFLDCEEKQVAIITGPNMAGKSTYIRQVALIVLMAQIGSFVPASYMEFKPVDRIFTRIGASDNLAAGESTFLVEMNETANILNNATSDSLIILDEVGRGTSTYDGVAIAWAVAEYIHNNIGSKTLFATHYHELVDLEKNLQRIKNYNVAVKETKENIIFLRKIEKGGTDKSYGVHVAQLAGIPYKVISKAKKILLSLEQEGMFEVKHIESELTVKEQQPPKQIQLPTTLPEDPAIKELKKLDINKITPIEALEKLNEIIRKLKAHE